MSKIILDFLKTARNPITNSTYGDSYRCSAYLVDGTYLPCVVLRKSEPIAQLALKRFEQEKKGKGIFGSSRSADAYEKIVKHFVTSGNRLSNYDIANLEPSKYAIPLTLLSKIEGETTMGWTGFVLEMRDGKALPFGTSFGMEFFNIPENYTFEDVVAVHNHSYVSSLGEIKPLTEGMSAQPTEYDTSVVCRERPYFVCYYDT
ncbi:MAG TPA: hypothetical protein VNW52_08305 [Burkholderiaceae bacterium]|jgi:hypothetical protein|nr:hypothetical protein [Burkholderiaceae bacterium]